MPCVRWGARSWHRSLRAGAGPADRLNAAVRRRADWVPDPGRVPRWLPSDHLSTRLRDTDHPEDHP